MSYAKEAALVQKLARLTSTSAIDWKPAVQPNTFQVSFRENTVRISTRGGSAIEDPDIEIQLLNGSGEVVERFTDVDLKNDEEVGAAERWFVLMKDLFAGARKTALGADRILNEIISDLDDIIPF